jgi:hypothetical protein
LPREAAFWILAGLFLMLFFASAAASPLYPVYQARFRFWAATLTAVFAVYVLVLLITLLFLGSLSDYLGRLPVIITALVLSVAGCAVFLAAHDTGALFIARSLQGIATGLATGPIGAALIDLQPPGSQRAPLLTSAFSTLGLALGALATSALVQYARAPGLPGRVPHDPRLGHSQSAGRPGDGRIRRGLPRVQRSGADRRRRDHEVRAARHGPDLLRVDRRLGRGRNWPPAGPSRRQGHQFALGRG